MKPKKIYKDIHSKIKQYDIVFSRNQQGFSVIGQDIVSPYPIITLCHQGSARLLYNRREYTLSKNDLFVTMPNNVMNQIESSEDCILTRIIISDKLFEEVHNIVSTNYDTARFGPVCKLKEDRAELLLKIIDALEDIVSYNAKTFLIRHQLVLSQLFVLLEFIHFQYLSKKIIKSVRPNSEYYERFCKLIIEHYKESRLVQFYANLLNLTPKHFTKVIKQETGGVSAAAFIEQYVVAQAKLLIETQPEKTLGEIAYELGFPDPTSFYRYFKRVAGMTAKQYKKSYTG